MLSEHHFDKIANLNLLNQSEQYRLMRDRKNTYDENAVAVYFGTLKIGYLERAKAAIVAKFIDKGDVFSVAYITGYKSIHYNAEHDNEKGDGYYRKLLVRITNESGLALAQGNELDHTIKIKYQQLHHNPALTETSGTSVTGCLLIFLFLIILFLIFTALVS